MNRLRVFLASLALSALVCMSHASATSYAVLFCGGGQSWDASEPSFLYETSRIYQTVVTDYGYEPQNVRVLFGDGDDAGLDALRRDSSGAMYAVSSPGDLDGDGVSDFDGAGTKAALQAAFGQLAVDTQPSDSLLFWTLGHGVTDGGHSYLATWQGMSFADAVSDDELGALCGALSAERQVFVLGECGSAGFIPAVGGPGRLVYAACRPEEITFGSIYSPSGDDTYEFPYRWWEAVDLDAAGGANPDADTNGDGRVSMAEAFAYAKAQDRFAALGLEHPQYDDPSGIGDTTFLGGPGPGAVPEPTPALLILLGLAALRGLAVTSRRHKRGSQT